jgi:adenylate cyclase
MAAVAMSAKGARLAERRLAVLLYAELRNFTRMSEVLEPSVVLKLAGEFFSLAAQAVIARGGEVVSVQNDSVLAAFSTGRPTHFAAQALESARHVQQHFQPVGERWRTAYGFPAAVALGLHLGEAVFGMAGPQGAEQYVAFGDCVSIAERLVHRARAGEITFSGILLKALGNAGEALGAEALPPLEIARRPAIPLYGLLLDTRLDFT